MKKNLRSLFNLFNKETRYQQRLSDLKENFEEAHSIFENECLTLLNRLRIVSQNNEVYLPVYENYNEQKESMKKGLQKDCELCLTSFEELLDSKNYKNIKDIYDSNVSTVNSYTKCCHDFLERLNAIFEKENELRGELVSIKDTYRKIKEHIDNYSDKVKPIMPSIELIFNGVDNLLREYEWHIDNLLFDKSNALKFELVKIINALKIEFNYLPAYCDKIYVEIPNELRRIQSLMVISVKENYYIDTQEVEKNIKQIDNILLLLRGCLNRLELSKIQSAITNLTYVLNSINEMFNKEKEAKHNFNTNSELMSDYVFFLQKEKAKLSNNLTNFTTYYKLNDAFYSNLDEFSSKLETITMLKQKLDINYAISTKNPYSIMVQVLNKFISIQKEALLTYTKIRTYLNSLKFKSENSYSAILNLANRIVTLENDLYSLNVLSVYDTYKNRINKIKDRVNTLYSTILTTPICLEQIEVEIADVSSLIENLNKTINEAVERLLQAQNFLLIANLYRNQFQSKHNYYIESEKSFFNGDFDKSISQSKLILQDIFPTLGE